MHSASASGLAAASLITNCGTKSMGQYTIPIAWWLLYRDEILALHEGMTNESDDEKRTPCTYLSLDFVNRITDTLPNRKVRRVKNRWGDDIWP